MEASCSLQSELGPVFEISSTSRISRLPCACVTASAMLESTPWLMALRRSSRVMVSHSTLPFCTTDNSGLEVNALELDMVRCDAVEDPYFACKRRQGGTMQAIFF